MSRASLEPILSLALSTQASPGMYALLLGSGVSRSAGMPTGWEVVLDLIRRLASAEGEDSEPAPKAWYTGKYGIEPTYSGLLDAVAKSPAERSSLLRGYFEPTADDSEEGLKVPTEAHRAIARLVKTGMARVILTTNFDRLIEQSLETEGVNPSVIRTPDDVDGAMPLVHSPCTVIKVHGDYLDLRTKNTPAELKTYDPRMDALLDRVFDEYGLIVCGWSGEWDTALCNAICRAKEQRFTTYWATLGKLEDTAEHIVKQQMAEVITITGADQFFAELTQKIDAIESMSQPHPVSAKMVVTQTKKYLADPKCRIQLHDLLMGEVERITRETGPEKYPVTGSAENADVEQRIADFEAISSVGIAIMSTGCFWSTEDLHDLWVRALNRLANPEGLSGGSVSLLGLVRYPALLLHYAGGIASAAAGKLTTIRALLVEPQADTYTSERFFSTDLFRELQPNTFKCVAALERMTIPRTERLDRALREPLRNLIPSDESYTRAFDLFETLQSLEAADRTQWAMPGAFMYRYYVIRGGKRIARRDGSPLLEMIREVDEAGAEAKVLRAGFCGGTVDRFRGAVVQIDEMTKEFHF
ncbi:MAG: SIR2 family protein [Phycisphaerae bacterium]|nr:SIR2 family protein [Phycisphaerae bacterium]